MVTVMDREIKKRYKIMSTFESDTAYQNALKYACHTHSLRNIIMVISILSVFGAEFSLLTVMFGKNNVIITAVTIIFIICSVVLTFLIDVPEIDSFTIDYLNMIARKNYQIIGKNRTISFAKDDETLSLLKNEYIVSSHQSKPLLEQYEIQEQEYFFIDSTGDVTLRKEAVLVSKLEKKKV